MTTSLTGNPTPVTTLDPPGPFDLNYYDNGAKVAQLFEGIDNERGVPAALADYAPELDRNVVPAILSVTVQISLMNEYCSEFSNRFG